MFKAEAKYTPLPIGNLIRTDMSNFLHNTVADYVKDYLNEKIQTQVDSTGKRMPIKKDSTKKQYNRHGWDTEHWFVRTGQSTVLDSRNFPTAVEIFPAKPEILKYNHDKAPIFYMSPELKTKLDILISNYLKKGF